MRATIKKVFRFEAAHHLPNHDGKCREPHGHSYKVEVVVEGEINSKPDHPQEGMVIDFADIKNVWVQHLKPYLDHKDLNVSLESWHLCTTTAENIAAWICYRFRAHSIPVKCVTVWETETASATVNYLEVWAHAG